MPTSPPVRRPLRIVGVLVAASAFVWGVSALGLVLLGRNVRGPRTIELVIPAGAARRVAAGANPLGVPRSLSFASGDLLVLRNDDAVPHRVGPSVVPPGGETTILMRPSTAGAFVCTVHPSGSLAFDVAPRASDLRLTLLPTLLLGPPLGAVVLGIRRILRALDAP